MKIEAVDFFYLSMPEIKDIADGSQDALLVRIQAGGYEGWGECEASPLPSIASYVCPKSHGICKPVNASVIGQNIEDISDIFKINLLVRKNSLDLLQTDHTLSGIDIALWDLLGKKYQEPVYALLGYPKAFPKTPYASQLFGATANETFEKGKNMQQQGYQAVKFGWGPFGRSTLQQDADQIYAAREGVGDDCLLLVDAGTVWIDNYEMARKRLKALENCKVTWLEEPFVSGALSAYKKLSEATTHLKLAGGERCHNFYMAQNMMEYAGIGYIQIDAGRIGGITTAKQVADDARKRGITFVNHTFTTHLQLNASLQPYAGIQSDTICEYPVEPTPLAANLTQQKIQMDENGLIHLPESPGLGINPDLEVMEEYLVDVEIKVNGEVLYTTPQLR